MKKYQVRHCKSRHGCDKKSCISELSKPILNLGLLTSSKIFLKIYETGLSLSIFQVDLMISENARRCTSRLDRVQNFAQIKNLEVADPTNLA